MGHRRTRQGSESGQRIRSRFRRIASVLVAAALVSTALFLMPATATAGESTVTPAKTSYLVLPPENRSEDRAWYWLGEALGESMEKMLVAAGVDIATREERRDIEQDEMGFGPLNVPTIATRLKEAEALKVDRIVSGWFTARKGSAWTEVTVMLQVINAPETRRGPVKTIGPLPMEKLGELQTAVARGLLELERIPAPAEIPRPPAQETGRAAYEARVKALLEEAPDKAAAYLVRALQSDPEYLRARVELASLQRDGGDEDRALETLLARPLLGDPVTAATGERMAGELLLEVSRPNAAVDAFRRALRWREDGSTHLSLARALIFRGDLQIASAEVELARRLDPDDPELAELKTLLASPPPPMREDTPPAGTAPAATAPAAN